MEGWTGSWWAPSPARRPPPRSSPAVTSTVTGAGSPPWCCRRGGLRSLPRLGAGRARGWPARRSRCSWRPPWSRCPACWRCPAPAPTPTATSGTAGCSWPGSRRTATPRSTTGWRRCATRCSSRASARRSAPATAPRHCRTTARGCCGSAATTAGCASTGPGCRRSTPRWRRSGSPRSPRSPPGCRHHRPAAGQRAARRARRRAARPAAAAPPAGLPASPSSGRGHRRWPWRPRAARTSTSSRRRWSCWRSAPPAP